MWPCVLASRIIQSTKVLCIVQDRHGARVEFSTLPLLIGLIGMGWDGWDGGIRVIDRIVLQYLSNLVLPSRTTN